MNYFKLIFAETAQELSRVNYKNRVEKEKQNELKTLMSWIQDRIDDGDNHLFIHNHSLRHEDNRKVLEELGYKIEDVYDHGKKIIWDEKED